MILEARRDLVKPSLVDVLRFAPPFGSGLPLSHPIKLGGPAAPSFPTIANLTMRLESDLDVTDSSGDVTGWLDQAQAINFEAAGGARPTLVANQIGSLPAIRFDGAANVMVSSAALLSDILTGPSPNAFKIVAVLKNNSAVPHASTSYDAPPVFCDSTSYFSGLSGDATRIDAGFFAGPDALVSVIQATGAVIYAEATLTTAAGGTLSLQVGTGGTPATATGVGAVGAATGFLKLGRNYANAVFWQGDLFALYVATSMSASEVGDLRTYINAKWGPGL